jgi:hypothetical protein
VNLDSVHQCEAARLRSWALSRRAQLRALVGSCVELGAIVAAPLERRRDHVLDLSVEMPVHQLDIEALCKEHGIGERPHVVWRVLPQLRLLLWWQAYAELVAQVFEQSMCFELAEHS